ncbi:MAG: nucleotidyltransferase domain-containing protein [Thermodesulfovibrionales bacterium]|nr:nucleotidyltransferase domain-containing protein [Thermodesulfovibrionales bacterium]
MASSTDSVLNLLEKYLNRLKENNIPVQKALLFGSYAIGKQREDSDIDVAVISTAFKGDRYSDRRMIVHFRRGLDSRIEPMPFTPKDFAEGGILIDEIKKTGQAILG